MDMFYKTIAIVMLAGISLIILIWLFVWLNGTKAREWWMVCRIEWAMGFKLYGWQREYILHGGRLPQNLQGKTTAYIIRMLITRTDTDILILDMEDVWYISEQKLPEGQSIVTYCSSYLHKIMRIWQKLFDAGITVRNLIVRAGIDRRAFEEPMSSGIQQR